ncbi:MAG TPA: cytoplasmic protein [Longimicrobium sp.]|nr:cytoplasmic protein [Longimicrobium sp.]
MPPRRRDEPELDISDAHRASSLHREQVLASEVCGCFYCRRTYPPSEIQEWTDGGETALCPRCGIDAVIGSASGWPITRELLTRMKSFWFGAA